MQIFKGQPEKSHQTAPLFKNYFSNSLRNSNALFGFVKIHGSLVLHVIGHYLIGFFNNLSLGPLFSPQFAMFLVFWPVSRLAVSAAVVRQLALQAKQQFAVFLFLLAIETHVLLPLVFGFFVQFLETIAGQPRGEQPHGRPSRIAVRIAKFLAEAVQIMQLIALATACLVIFHRQKECGPIDNIEFRENSKGAQ